MAGIDYASGTGYKLEVDGDQLLSTPTGTPAFAELNVTEVSEAFNEAVDTFFKLSDGGYATNVVTGLDPQFDLTIKFAKDDTVGIDFLKKRFNVDRKAPFKITDNHTTEVIDFSGEITAMSSARNVDGGATEVSATIKLRGAPTIA